MELKFILAIIAVGVFAIVCAYFLYQFVIARRKEVAENQRIEDMYADENLVKMEYDFAVYDEETERLIEKTAAQGRSVAADEIIAENAEDSVFGTVDTDGLEEITGSYKPEQYDGN